MFCATNVIGVWVDEETGEERTTYIHIGEARTRWIPGVRFRKANREEGGFFKLIPNHYNGPKYAETLKLFVERILEEDNFRDRKQKTWVEKFKNEVIGWNGRHPSYIPRFRKIFNNFVENLEKSVSNNVIDTDDLTAVLRFILGWCYQRGKHRFF